MQDVNVKKDQMSVSDTDLKLMPGVTGAKSWFLPLRDVNIMICPPQHFLNMCQKSRRDVDLEHLMYVKMFAPSSISLVLFLLSGYTCHFLFLTFLGHPAKHNNQRTLSSLSLCLCKLKSVALIGIREPVN